MKFNSIRQAALVAVSLSATAGAALAQEKTIPIQLNASAYAAAKTADKGAEHALGLLGVNLTALWASGRPLSLRSSVVGPTTGPASEIGFYPGDLSNPGNGPVVLESQSHSIYVNCDSSCWGFPDTFLANLGNSAMIHITDQYTGIHANNRYQVGTGAMLTGYLPQTIYDTDVIAIVYAAASYLTSLGDAGTGYRHIYHVFLPPGTDLCITGSTECYSPDNLSTFIFCAYHSSVDFSDIGHVLYTAEPYQNVNGCSVQQPSPNGPLVDSTADVLGHETFETITDPDGTSWLNNFSLPLYGAELADECQQAYFNYSTVELNGTNYEIQPMYSNTYHGCVYLPAQPPLL